jgi:predicted nucleic acid-binding protein
MIILDTNVLSEVMRPAPGHHVVLWLDKLRPENGYTTAITKAEILYGIEVAPHGSKRSALAKLADRLFSGQFSGRVLAFEDEAAAHYAQISALRRSRGRPIKPADAQIAAIARLHHATLATRNTPDFEDCGIRLVNPWEA